MQFFKKLLISFIENTHQKIYIFSPIIIEILTIFLSFINIAMCQCPLK